MESKLSTAKKIQQLIADSGKTRYQLAKESTLRESTLQRVELPDWGQQLETAEKVLHALGYKLNIVKKAKKERRNDAT